MSDRITASLKRGWVLLFALALSNHAYAQWTANCNYSDVDGSQRSENYASQQECLNAINATFTSRSHCNCVQSGGGNGGGGGYTGPSAEQIQHNKNTADAANLNQEGQQALDSGDYDTAIDKFQQALDKTPGDSMIEQNLRNAQDKLAAKHKFDEDKADALGNLKGVSKNGDNSGLKGMDDADNGGLKGVSSDNSTELKSMDDPDDEGFMKGQPKKQHQRNSEVFNQKPPKPTATVDKTKQAKASSPTKTQTVTAKRTRGPARHANLTVDGVQLFAKPDGLEKDQLSVTNNNTYKVDVTIHLKTGSNNCSHSFSDLILDPGQTLNGGWVGNVEDETPWRYTLGMTVSKSGN